MLSMERLLVRRGWDYAISGFPLAVCQPGQANVVRSLCANALKYFTCLPMLLEPFQERPNEKNISLIRSHPFTSVVHRCLLEQ
jgi:hypothetical protein